MQQIEQGVVAGVLGPAHVSGNPRVNTCMKSILKENGEVSETAF